LTKLFFIFILTIILGCADTSSKKSGKTSLTIDFEVIPENDSSYTLVWTDTLGKSKGYSISQRPYELKCFFIDSKDTAGYYNGLSTPDNSTWIETYDSTVTAHFELGINFFMEASEEERNKAFQNARTTKFNSVKIDLRKGLRKKTEIVLTEK
jgi:hypothetical protein